MCIQEPQRSSSLQVPAILREARKQKTELKTEGRVCLEAVQPHEVKGESSIPVENGGPRSTHRRRRIKHQMKNGSSLHAEPKGHTLPPSTPCMPPTPGGRGIPARDASSRTVTSLTSPARSSPNTHRDLSWISWKCRVSLFLFLSLFCTPLVNVTTQIF